MILRILACLFFVAVLIPAQEAPPKPLTRQQVTAMVRDGLADESGAKLVTQRGLDFNADQDFLDNLRKAGASGAFLKAVEEASRPAGALHAKHPLNKVGITALVENGVESPRVAELIREGGIDFEPSEAYLKDLKSKGAGQEVLDALQTAQKMPAATAHGGAAKSLSKASGCAKVTRIRVGGMAQAAKLAYQSAPTYPPLAKMARIQGTVRLEVIVDTDGTVQHIKVVSAHPMLVQSAIEAVSQWQYQPTIVNGCPAEVLTEVDVSYTLAL